MWGPVPSVHCEPFAGETLFPSAGALYTETWSGKQTTLSFTMFARNVPPGSGTVNLRLSASCSLACTGPPYDALSVKTLTAVVQAIEQ